MNVKKHSIKYFFSMVLVLGVCTHAAQAVDFSTLPTPPETTWDKMWEIQLINNDNLIAGDVDITFSTFDGQQVDQRAGVHYKEMYDHAKEDGITLYLRSGYRSISLQKVVYDQGVQRYMSNGYSYATAISIANRYYATPGGSEHNVGLAFDIITPHYHNTTFSLNETFANTEAYHWLMAHCAEHGFILRYPKGRTAETGINFEPWHYRYVGVEHAEYIMNHNLILEEYVELYKMTYPALYSDTPPVETTPMTPLDPDLIIHLPPEPEPKPDRPLYQDYLAKGFYQFTEASYLSQLFW